MLSGLNVISESIHVKPKSFLNLALKIKKQVRVKYFRLGFRPEIINIMCLLKKLLHVKDPYNSVNWISAWKI